MILSSQKNHRSGGDQDINCYTVLESTLPRFIYGAQTGTDIKGYGKFHLQGKDTPVLAKQRKCQGIRQKRCALDKAVTNYDSRIHVQGIMVAVFGQQQRQRERSSVSWKRTITPPPHRETFEAEIGVKHEFDIGLDIESGILTAHHIC